MIDDPDYLGPDDNLAEAIATRESFFAHAPLGRRGEVRNVIKWLAAEQGKTVTVSAAWGDYPHYNGADYLYVQVYA